MNAVHNTPGVLTFILRTHFSRDFCAGPHATRLPLYRASQFSPFSHALSQRRGSLCSRLSFIPACPPPHRFLPHSLRISPRIVTLPRYTAYLHRGLRLFSLLRALLISTAPACCLPHYTARAATHKHHNAARLGFGMVALRMPPVWYVAYCLSGTPRHRYRCRLRAQPFLYLAPSFAWISRGFCRALRCAPAFLRNCLPAPPAFLTARLTAILPPTDLLLPPLFFCARRLF